MKKILFNTFALIGFGTFIFLACSVAEPEPEPTEPPQTTNVEVDATLLNEYGKYQVETLDENLKIILVLNTETGAMKRYTANNGAWNEATAYAITFSH